MARGRQRRRSGATPAQLERALERNDIAPVYLIHGEEAFLRRKAIEAVIGAVCDAEDGDLAVDRLDGSTTSTAAILDAARSLSLFLPSEEGPVRVVLVRAFDPGTTEDAELLAAYLDDPVPATCLVLEAEKVDSRRAAVKLLGSRATVVECKPPERDAEVRRWIGRAAASRGFEIDPDAVAYLLEMIGPDLQQLDQELDKLELYAADAGRLSAGDLQSLMGRSREHTVFELTDALVAGRAATALRVLNMLLDDGEEPLRILAMVSWVVRQLITARDLADRGCPERELLKQLGGRWDQRRRVLEKARSSAPDALEELLTRCAASDATVKVQPGAGGRGTLEGLCRRVCAA